MALKVVLKRDIGLSNSEVDCWAGADGTWEFEVFMPRTEQPTSADVYFEFDDEEQTEP